MHSIILSINGLSPYRTPASHRIATHLRSNGWDVEVLDFTLYWSFEELKEFFKSRITNKTKFIGFSFLYSFTSENELIEKVCKYLKQKYPDIILIGGGQFEPLYINYLDYFIIGYGETALDHLLKYEFSNGEIPIYNEHNNIKYIDTLKNYSASPWRNPTIIFNDNDFIQQNEWGFIEFARGCKFNCKFCNYPIRGANYDATRDKENVYEQLMDAYDRFGITNYTITDNTFNDTTEKISKFADVIEQLPFKPWFTGFIRADLLITRPADKHELLRMGMLGQFYGIESFNPETIKFIGKGLHPDKTKEGLIEIKDFFIKNVGKKFRPAINLIAGLPYETLESLELTLQWIKNNWFPLYTHTEVMEISRIANNKNSYISDNYSDLGYEELYNVHKIISPERDTSDHYLQWKNKYMNIRDARHYADKIQDLYKLKHLSMRLLDSLTLSSIMCEDDGSQVNLDKKLILTDHTAEPYKNNFGKFIIDYKHKKLSLKSGLNK